MEHRLAPMSGFLAVLTAIVLLLPVGIVAVGAATPGAPLAWAIAALLAATYAFTWFCMRPSRFVVDAEGLEVVWPLRRRFIPWSDVAGAATMRADELSAEFGLLLRVGVGGLWGGFGLAWSSRGKHLGLYVSRHADGFVLVRCGRTRSLLITPERPEEFTALVNERARRTGA
jgi:hypothetical protein